MNLLLLLLWTREISFLACLQQLKWKAERPVNWKNKWMHIKSTTDGGKKNSNQPVESCSQRLKRLNGITTS